MYCVLLLLSMSPSNLKKHFTFTFSHLADAFIQSDLQCIHIFFYISHCTSGAIRNSVSCSRTLRQGIERATFCLLNDFFTSCSTVVPILMEPNQCSDMETPSCKRPALCSPNAC